MNFKETTLEVVTSILPICLIILILQLTLVRFPLDVLIKFIAGAVMVIVGLILFLTGINVGLVPVGELIGSSLVKLGKLLPVLLWGFVIGFSVIVAEPNIQVLAQQVNTVTSGAIPKNMLIIAVALGVGIFIVLSLLRIIFNIPLIYMLGTSYILVFTLAAFTPTEFVPVSFDAGGVTTGPLTVPFILALGVGFTSVTQSKKSSNDSFGLISLIFIGAILAVLLLGVVFK